MIQVTMQASMHVQSPTGPDRKRFTAAYRVLEDAIDKQAFPGCAFGVLAVGEAVIMDGLGGFTYDANSTRVTAETAFDIASLTKVVATTAACMLLHQRGQLDLDWLLGDILPGFVVGRPPGEYARNVRLRHLIAHNSGLPGYVEFFRKDVTGAGLLRACLDLPIEAEPGTRVEYSDPGFILLGKALEVLTRESLENWVRRELLVPLQLSATGFNPPSSIWPQIPPTEEDNTFRMRVIRGEVQDENAWVLGGIAGHAGLFSNVPDLLRFASEILEGRNGRASLFQQETIELFAERQSPEGSSRALGWDTPSAKSSSGSLFSPHSIGHLGFSGCSLWIDLEAKIAVVLLTNRTWPDRKSQLIREVRPAYHDAIREALQ
jgi:CubicO group peptidase (beta-lactamase class C family)